MRIQKEGFKAGFKAAGFFLSRALVMAVKNGDYSSLQSESTFLSFRHNGVKEFGCNKTADYPHLREDIYFAADRP
jgi:hypothetical protein